MASAIWTCSLHRRYKSSHSQPQIPGVLASSIPCEQGRVSSTSQSNLPARDHVSRVVLVSIVLVLLAQKYTLSNKGDYLCL